MNISGIGRQLAKLREQLPTPEGEMYIVHLELLPSDVFTPEEDARADALTRRLAFSSVGTHAQIHLKEIDPLDRHELGAWFHLEEALRTGDSAEAAKQRTYLALCGRELVEQFLALGTRLTPDELDYMRRELFSGLYYGAIVHDIEAGRAAHWLDYMSRACGFFKPLVVSTTEGQFV